MDYKKGMTLGDAAGMALSFVVFVVMVSVGGLVLAGIQTGQVTDSVAYNVTGFGLTGITNLGNQAGTIGTIIGAAILISIVVGAFYFARKE